MRLDQFLQKACFITRNEARFLLKKKKITVNGRLMSLAKQQVDPVQDIICQGDLTLTLPVLRYYALNKPAGYVCSHHYDGGIPVFELIDDKHAYALHCAGRLDIDTTGLVLLSDDGLWSHQVTHPGRACIKVYQVTLRDRVTAAMVDRLETGVHLHGETQLTRPAKIAVCSETEIELSLTEGRYHQVKRMIAAVNNQVVGLHRTRIGCVTLEGINQGSYRPLKLEEQEYFNHG